MIASITGRLARKSADYVIVDVSGIGYQVHVPLSTFCNMPDEGEVSLHIYTHIREDALSLFGFLTEAEKELFVLLMGVSGIGPKLALAVLSSMPVDEVIGAIRDSDDSRLCSIPGIGKKTAGRIILELKDKVKTISCPMPGGRGPLEAGFDNHFADAVSALVSLGYKEVLAEDALKRVRAQRPDLGVEGLIKEALNVLMKR